MPIDLRSDTVTRPTAAMRDAMATADVGDDVYGEDPTINRLQELAASMFDREAALLVPSGVMGNQLALRVLGEPGTEVVVEEDGHLVDYEAGAGAIFAGVQFRTVPTERGLMDPQQVRDAIRPDAYHLTPTSLVALEQTHNRKGGTVYPLEHLEAVGKVAHDAGVRVHIDGARIFNAAVASGVDVSVFAGVGDTVMFCLSKGLGAPVGSMLVGDADVIAEAHTWRRRFGGAMRQAGILAAAGVHALEHHVERLADDHANARLIAEVVADAAPGSVDLEQVQTNIVYVDTGARDSSELVAALGEDDILVGAMGPSTLRLVTHLDVDEPGCRHAAETLARHLA